MRIKQIVVICSKDVRFRLLKGKMTKWHNVSSMNWRDIHDEYGLGQNEKDK
jgi:hypothetical protein